MCLQSEETQCEKHLWQEFDFLKGFERQWGWLWHRESPKGGMMPCKACRT